MRFRYFDSEGTEVQLSSVDALEFRVKTGAVTPRTLLYDAAVGHWAPAADHPIYRFLTEEGAEPPPETPDDPGGHGAPPLPSEPAESPGSGADRPDLSFLSPGDGEHGGSGEDSEGTSEHRTTPASGAPSAEESGPRAPGPDVPTHDGPAEPAGAPSPEPVEAESPAPDPIEPDLPAPDPTEPEAPAPEPVARDAPRADSEPTSGPGGEGTTLRASPSRGWGVRVDEVEIPAPLVTRAEPEPADSGPSATARLWSTVAAGLATAVRWILVLGLIAVVAAGIVFGLRHVDAEAMLQRFELPRVEIDLPRVEAVRAAAFGGGDDESGTSTADPGSPAPEASDPPSAASGGGPSAITDTEEIESLVPEVAAAATADLADAMVELRGALGVAESPPEPWLDGVYLAGAGRYPEVGNYWRSYGRWVAAVESMEEELFRGYVQDRVLRTGLDSAEAAALSARIMERHRRTARQRELVYRDLASLADEALALHETLARNEAAISYEPFSGRDLSRDPVIEAVPNDPELARRIWSRLDRIFEILERVQGVRPVSTPRLQEALFGFSVPERGS